MQPSARAWGASLAAIGGERDLSTEQTHSRALRIVHRAGLRGPEQSERVVDSARFVLALSRR